MPIAPAVPSLRPFRYLRQALPWLLVLAAATCTQDQLDPSRGSVGYFSFRPVYGLAGGAHLSQFGIVADSIHVRLTRPVAQVVLDTTVFFPPDSTQLHLALPVQIEQSPESLTALIEISAGGVVLFRDSVDVEVKDGPPGASTPPTVSFTYIGPGSNIGTLQLIPGDTTIVLQDTLFFSALAFDSSAAPVASFYVGWKTGDTTIARINGNGRLIAPAARGSVAVIGTTPTGIVDTTIVIFAPFPVIISADSGAAQSGLVADSLGALFVARVKGADSLPIAGIPVEFKAVTAGGAVRDTLVLTDAQGRARTRGVLGTGVATYSYSATVATAKSLTTSFSATATAAPGAAIAILTGNAQVDTAGILLPLPFQVAVTDAFGNPAPGAQVVYTRLIGGGTPALDTLTTDALGHASLPYTLGGGVGIDSVQASLAGTSAFVVFTATSVNGGPASVAVDSGDAQSATVTTSYTDSLVARVTDAHGNPVPGAQVAWSVTLGTGSLSSDTTIAGSDGRARVAVTAGTGAGALHVQGSAAGAGSSAQFVLSVGAGAPASLVLVSGDAQSAVPSGVVAQPLVVAVRDAFGNGVAGLGVDFTVIAGLGSVDSATAITDASGLANSGNWTLGPVAGTNQVRATAVAVAADTLTFTATGLPIGTTKQWVGAIDALWSTAGNWSPVGVPTAGDNVFIPVTVTGPTVDVTSSIGGLQVEAGATVTIPTVTLSTSGNVEVDGAVAGAGRLSANGTGTTLAGTFTGPILRVQGTVTQAGPVSSTGQVTLAAGTLTPNGFPLLAAGNMAINGSGQLVMGNAADSVDVTGSLAVSTSTTGTGLLSAGVLVLRGGFSQSGATTSFAPGGTHLTRFLGTGPQTITFTNPGSANSRFQEIEFGTPGGITLGSTVTVMGNTLVSAGTITGIGRTINLGGNLVTSYAAWQVSTTLWGASPAIYPDSLPRNVTVFNAWTLNKSFKTDSAVTVSGTGVLTLNGHTLRTGTGFTQGGRLVMLQPQDTLDVGGAFLVNSGVTGVGDMVDGRLILRGGFTQNAGSFTNFAPSSTHLTAFLGTGGHTVSFTSADNATQSHFHGLTVADSLGVTGILAASGNVTIDSTGRVTGVGAGKLLGALVDSSLAGWRMGNTFLDGKFQSIPAALVTNVFLSDSIALAQPTTVTGSFTLQNAGYIAFSGHGLGVSGNFTQDATLEMNSTQDSLEVGGNFLVSSGNDGTGKLVAGAIVVHGSFTQTAGSFTNFVAGAPHRVRFTGPAARVIDLTNPAQILFGDLEVDATGLITLNTSVNVTGTFRKPAGPVSSFTAAAQRVLTTNDLAVDGASFDRVRIVAHPTSNAAQFDSVTFTNVSAAQTQLSLELPGLAGDTLKFHNVAFSGVPTSGKYVFVADSVANGAPATIGFYNSTPLNGAAFTAIDASAGDSAQILWSHLDWVTQPTDGILLLPLSGAPQVGAFDPSGVALTGYTGTVTLSFLVNPIGAVLGGNSAPAVGGVATFDSLTVSLAAIGFRLQAASPELGTSPGSSLFTISVPLPAGTTTAFTNDGGDGSWDNPANWTAGVPDSADNIFIYPNLTATVDNPSRANRVTIGTGASLLLNNTLTVDSTVAAGNTISGGGQLVAAGTGFLSGVVSGLVVTGNYAVPASDTLTAGFINISGAGAVLDPGSARIVAIDSLRTEAGGRLDMNDPAAVVQVQGRARFTGGTPSLLAGTLEVGGDFSQEENVGAFTPGPAFVTLFNGGGTQTASFFSPDTASDRFGILGLTGGGTLHLATTTPILGDIDIQGGHVVADSQALVLGTITGATGAFMEGNALTLVGNFTFGGVYTVANTFFVGTGQTIQQAVTPFDTVYVQGSAALAGNITANVLYVIALGHFDLNGHRLDVTTDFGTGSGGVFSMTDPADTVMVGGTFFAMGGSTTGLLTDGLIQIAGSFYQGSTPADTFAVETQGPPPALDAFRASGAHVTRFTGTPATERTIFFGSPVQPADPFSTANSEFGRLELIDGRDSIGSTIPVAADLLVDSAHVLNAVSLGGGPAVAGNVQVGASVPEFTVTNLSLGGVLDFQPAPAIYQVGTTLFFGTTQSVPVLPYQDIEVVMGQATLAGDIAAQNVRTGVASEGPGFPGDLKLGGHKLILAGNFTTVGEGTFTMDDPADSLDVTGNMDLGGGVTAGLTAGTVVARGDMYLSDSNFIASGTHRTVFAAPVAQQLWITTAVDDQGDQFNKLDVAAGTTVNFNAFSVGPLVVKDTFAINGHFTQANPGKAVIALGDLYAGLAASITVDYVELHKSLDIDASSYSVQLTRYAGTGQIVSATTSYNDLDVTGTGAVLDATVTVNHDFAIHGGDFDPAGHTLQIAHDLLVDEDGLLKMSTATDSVNVGFTATFDGRDSDGWLTAGTLTFNYFKQLATTSPNAFRATGAHRALMLGQNPNDETEMITFATPGAAVSQFQELEFNSGGVGSGFTYFGAGTIFVADSLYIPAGGAGGLFGSGTTLIVGGPMAVQTTTIPIQIDTLELRATVEVPVSSLNNTVTRFAGVSQLIPDTQSYQRLEITGTASPEGTAAITANEIEISGNGQFTLGAGQRATSSGNFATIGNGTLQMNGAGADLFIGGDALFAGGSAGPLLSDGTIRVAGNFTTQAGNSNDPFNSFNTGVTFLGGSGVQTVTIDPATNGNFRAIGVTNPSGIQINGLMIVIDSVGTSGPIVGDSLYEFGNFFMNAGSQVGLKVLKTAGIFAGTPSLYAVGRTHIVNPNSLPNVPFDTLVINSLGVSAFYPLSANVLYIAGNGSAFSGVGGQASLDLGIVSSPLTHSIAGDLHVEGGGAVLAVAEDTVNVGGDFFTSLGGTLQMNGSGALQVTGSTLFGGASEEGQLTSGTLLVGSGITQQSFSSPSSFRMDGTVLDLPAGPTHFINIQSPDSSWLPDISSGTATPLSISIIGRARVAGGIDGYGVILSGDTLVTDGQLVSGPAGLSVTLKRYEGPVFYQFQNVSNWTVSTTQFTGDGGLPFSGNFAFDTLIVSANVQGQLSQLLTANYVEVTGPGNPRHLGSSVGALGLSGGDGNTTLDVSGDVLVRGAGAHISSFEGNFSATGNFTVDQDGYFASSGSFGGGSWSVGGDVLIDGTITRDSLVNGTLTIGGNFTQKGTTAGSSYAPDSTFITGFTGAGPHHVSFETPGDASIPGSHSYFGGLAVGDAGGAQVIDFAGDYFVEGVLTTTSSNGVTFQNDSTALGSLNVQDVNIQNLTFDHLQFHLEKHSDPAAGTGTIDGVTFTNFQGNEDQFVVTLPGLSTQFSWFGFTFSQLALDGSDTGKYVVATDWDGATPNPFNISLQTNNATGPELTNYYSALNGAILFPFSP